MLVVTKLLIETSIAENVYSLLKRPHIWIFILKVQYPICLYVKMIYKDLTWSFVNTVKYKNGRHKLSIVKRKRDGFKPWKLYL